MHKLSEDHPIYTTVFPMKMRLPLSGVSNGVRLMMVHSPTDLAKAWQRRTERTNKAPFELGLNLAIYAAGSRELRNRARIDLYPRPARAAVSSAGPRGAARQGRKADPEPRWQRFARWFENETRLRLNVTPVEATDLKIEQTPLAVLTGVEPIQLTNEEIEALRVFVTKGGVLLIDACGGSRRWPSRSRLIS